jgi:hypothetical protein
MVLAKAERVGLMVRSIVLLLMVSPGLVWADSVTLILSGVPGSPAHETRFSEWTEATRQTMVDTFGFQEENVLVLQNRDARAQDIREIFSQLDARLTQDDTFFLFFIGHGSFDGTDYKFNTMGADLTASDYNDLVSSLDAGRTVIINATNSSGGAIEELAAENRVIVTATRTGTERNDTVFYDYFLEALTDGASDEDKNERLSVWEAFRYATLAVERFYSEQNRLATEHPQISDNGRENTGAEPDETPTLARLINFNSQLDAAVADPALRALMEQRDQLEADIEALRLISDTMPPEEYESRMEALLIELALKNQEVRGREQETEGDNP